MCIRKGEIRKKSENPAQLIREIAGHRGLEDDEMKNVPVFCSNPKCALHHFYDENANKTRRIAYLDPEGNHIRTLERKLYVGIEGSGPLWFCSDCADVIEREKDCQQSLSGERKGGACLKGFSSRCI